MVIPLLLVMLAGLLGGIWEVLTDIRSELRMIRDKMTIKAHAARLLAEHDQVRRYGPGIPWTGSGNKPERGSK